MDVGCELTRICLGGKRHATPVWCVMEPSDEKLKDFEDRLSRAKAAQAPPQKQEEHYTLANQAWRMVIELVAGIAIGFGMGFGLDRLFGTMPIFLILFILLGLTAGVRTMMRTAQEVQEKQAAQAAGEKEEG